MNSRIFCINVNIYRRSYKPDRWRVRYTVGSVCDPFTGAAYKVTFDAVAMADSASTDLSQMSKSREANWPAVLFYIHIHLLSLYGIWLLFFEAKLLTVLLLIALTLTATLGVTVGSHRLWAHRTYQASLELRVFLMLCQTLAGHGPIYDWVQHHRLHHAHFKTDSDLHDSRKGFLYAQFITRFNKLSPYQEELKNSIDMSDLQADNVVMFQRRYYWVLYAVLFVILPINAPLEYWNDSVLSTLFVMGFVRYALVLHASWLLESGVCLWGLKEGEKYPPDSNSVFILNKTFWPEYHYIYPQDYKSGEFGTYGSGCSTAFIRVFAALRLATNLCTLESKTLQNALAENVKTNRPLKLCLEEAVSKQTLAEDHFLYHK